MGLIIGIVVFVIAFLLIGLIKDAEVQRIIKIVMLILFLLWLAGIVTGHNFIHL